MKHFPHCYRIYYVLSATMKKILIIINMKMENH
ncbi:hypothetical protein BLOT_012716 [Blomia tropicalis]|nr:hypothetical protein BLOT_012716 [Blomia tropicalis]